MGSCERENAIPQTATDARDPTLVPDREWLRATTQTKMPDDGKEMRLADLFSGCGGLSLGAWEACRRNGRRFVSVLAWDSNPTALDVYVANFQPAVSRSEAIESVLALKRTTQFRAAELELKTACGHVDVLLAGPPCQGHSTLNNHTRNADSRNRLYELVARAAQILKPSIVIAENVAAVLRDRGHHSERTASWLRELGYHVVEGLVDLSQIGVPQKRKRHVLVASLHPLPALQTMLEPFVVQQARSVRWAIGDLEDADPGPLLDRPPALSPANQRRISYLFESGTYDLPNGLRPRCHADVEHTYLSMYGRLRYDEPAQTVTTGFGSPGQGRYIHPARQRTLTPHEAARLQLFPDWFQFGTGHPRCSLATMIGNAAPMRLSHALLTFLFST
jgi:DNA (cytosine-5)-methyltransferase 1